MSVTRNGLRREPGIRSAVGCAAWLLLSVGLIWNLPRLQWYASRSNDQKVVSAFINAIRINDAMLAKFLVIPQKQPSIDRLLANHIAFECVSTWQFWAEEFWEASWAESGFGGPTEAGDLSKWNWGYDCRNPEYRITAIDIMLLKTNAGWLVTEWGKICEVRNGKESCF